MSVLQQVVEALSHGVFYEVSRRVASLRLVKESVPVGTVPDFLSSSGEDSDVAESQSCGVLFTDSREVFGHKLHRVACDRVRAQNTEAVAFLILKAFEVFSYRFLVYDVT